MSDNIENTAANPTNLVEDSTNTGSKDAAAPLSSVDKGKGKGKAAEPQVDEDEEDDDEDDEDDDDDDDDDDDELDDEDVGGAVDFGGEDGLDPDQIVGRRTRGKRVDYTSPEALQKAGISADDAGAEHEEEDEAFNDTSMEDADD